MDPGWDPMFIAYLWIACQTSCPAHSTWFWGIQPRATALKAKCKQMWLNKLDLKLLWVSHRSRKLPGKIVLNLIIWKAGPPFKFSNVIRFWYRKLNHSYGRSSNKYSSQFPKYPINTKELNRKRYLLVSRNRNQATAIRTVRCCLSHPLEMMEEIRCFGLHSLSASINFHQCRGTVEGTYISNRAEHLCNRHQPPTLQNPSNQLRGYSFPWGRKTKGLHTRWRAELSN